MSDDLISRQAAIDDAHRQIWYRLNPNMKERIDTWLVNLPSVQQEQNLAYWIGAELGKCSNCGHSGCASDIWNDCEQMFCPNCGAKMDYNTDWREGNEQDNSQWLHS